MAMKKSTSSVPHREAPALTIDRLDRQLLHALELDGRAPFRRLAGVLGSSEQTVSRRYRRLHDADVVRVLALPEPPPAGQSTLLRVQVQPAVARPLAAALAERPDVIWVGLMAGGAEVSCAVRARSREARDALILDRLPRSGRVLGITAYAVMHNFATPGRADWDGFDDPLTAAQKRRLAGARQTSASRASLTEADEPLLSALAEDGRATYADLAARADRSEAQVARRVDALLSSGAVYLDVDIATELLGFSTSAMLYLSVEPSQLHGVGEQLVGHPETAFVAAVTGPANLAASVLCTGLDHLYRYVTTTIGAIPAVQRVETNLVLERVKRAGSLRRDSQPALDM